MTAKKKVTCLYLRRETATRIDALKKQLALPNNIDVILKALKFLEPIAQTVPLPETTEGHYDTCQRFSADELTRLDALVHRFGEGRGAVIDRGIYLLDKHAKSIRRTELTNELAKLTAQSA